MKIFLIGLLAALNLIAADLNSDLLYDKDIYPLEVQKCATCHSLLKNDSLNDTAPNMNLIVQNIKFKYTNKLDQKNFLYNFLENPEKCDIDSKVLCEKHSSKKYGKMKEIELTSRESLLIVNFLIDKF